MMGRTLLLFEGVLARVADRVLGDVVEVAMLVVLPESISSLQPRSPGRSAMNFLAIETLKK